MPIPNTNMSVNTSSLYPDSITLNFQYTLPRVSFIRISEILRRDFRFRRTQDRNRVTGSIEVDGGVAGESQRNSLQVKMSRPSDAAPLSVVVGINPLTFFHLQRDDFGGEFGRNNAENWLHADDIRSENSHVSMQGALMIAEAESAILRFVQTLAQRISRNGHAELDRVTVRNVEVALDLSAEDPGAFVRRCEPIILRRFNNVLRNTYGSTAQSYGETDGEQYMVSGFAGRDERIKLYEKTNRRVRFECVVGRRAMRRHDIRSLSDHYDLDFRVFFDDVAASMLPHFETFLAEASSEHLPPGRSPTELIARISSRTSNHEKASDVLRILVRHGCIQGSYDRGLINRLMSDGILKRVRRGLYSVSSEYRRASELLMEDDARWWGFPWGVAA